MEKKFKCGECNKKAMDPFHELTVCFDGITRCFRCYVPYKNEEPKKLEKEIEELKRQLSKTIDPTKAAFDHWKVKELERDNESLKNQLQQEKSHLENMTKARDHFKQAFENKFITGQIHLSENNVFVIKAENNIKKLHATQGTEIYVKDGILASYLTEEMARMCKQKKERCEHIKVISPFSYWVSFAAISQTEQVIALSYQSDCEKCKVCLEIE